MYKEVSRLLKGHTELLAEFWQFLPDGFLPDGFCRQLVRQGLTGTLLSGCDDVQEVIANHVSGACAGMPTGTTPPPHGKSLDASMEQLQIDSQEIDSQIDSRQTDGMWMQQADGTWMQESRQQHVHS